MSERLNLELRFASIQPWWLVAALFAAALLLRMPSVVQELPPYTYCDEDVYAGEVLRMLQGGSWVVNEFRAGGLNIYPPLLLGKAWVLATGQPPAMSSLLVVGRAIYAVFLSSAAVVLVFGASKTMFKRVDIAFYSSVAFLLSPMILAASRSWYPDHYIVFFAALFVYFIAKVLDQPGSITSYVWLGVSWGMVTSVKYTGLLLLVALSLLAVPVARYFMASDSRIKAARATLARFAIVVGVALLVFIAINWSMIPHWGKFVADFRFNMSNYDRGNGVNWDGIGFYLYALYGLTLSAAGVIVYALGYALIWRLDRTKCLILLSFPIFLAAYLGKEHLILYRNMTIAVPFLLPVIGVGAAKLISYIRRPMSVAGGSAAVVVAVLLLVNGARVVTSVARDFNPDSRVVAQQWLAKGIPAGSTVGVNEFCSGPSPAAQNGNQIVIDPTMSRRLPFYVFNSYWSSALDPTYHRAQPLWRVGEIRNLQFYLPEESRVLGSESEMVPLSASVPDGYSLEKVFATEGPDIVVLKRIAPPAVVSEPATPPASPGSVVGVSGFEPAEGRFQWLSGMVGDLEVDAVCESCVARVRFSVSSFAVSRSVTVRGSDGNLVARLRVGSKPRFVTVPVDIRGGRGVLRVSASPGPQRISEAIGGADNRSVSLWIGEAKIVNEK